MTTFETKTTIDAPLGQVWEALADIGNIAAWNPGFLHSQATTEVKDGVGAERICDLGGEKFLNETVIDWLSGDVTALCPRVVLP